MNASFLLILLCATLFSGIIALIDKLVWAKQRAMVSTPKVPKLIEYSRSFFPVFLIVLLLRSFVGQLFVVPTGSLEPTIMPRAYIVVNQFAYGLHFPVTDWKLLNIGEPKRGDIVLFHSTTSPHMDLIKRLVGLPGDKISYINKVLYINGHEATQTPIGYATDSNGSGSPTWTVQVLQEDLLGVEHDIYVCPASSVNCPGASSSTDFYNLVVPQGEYFMMGDNRDDSDDGRFWGFVPAENVMGKGSFILFSWDSTNTSFRGSQFLKSL